jgi:hypothetical protein
MRVTKETQHKESIGSVETQKNLQWNADRDIPKGAVTGKNHDEAWRAHDLEMLEPLLHPQIMDRRSDMSTAAQGFWTHQTMNLMSRLPILPGDSGMLKMKFPRESFQTLLQIESSLLIVPRLILKPQLSLQKKQWDANKDIPRGKVKGMSNLFAGGNGSRAIPENHMEPLDPPGPSPANPYQTEVIKPTPIAASRSEDEASPLQLQTFQEVQATSAFYMANDNADSQAWTVPVSSSGSHFGQGTWGEEAALSHSNDEFDDQDWFQAGSFTEEDKKTDTEFVAFPDNGFLDSAHPLLDVEDDDDADLQTTGIGSFAAAIEPVTLRRQSTKPETVAEDLEEDDAGLRRGCCQFNPTRRKRDNQFCEQDSS